MPVTLEERPVFIIGSERSGTTLILAILACHPRIAVPEVTWYYPRFRPYLHTFGDLSDPKNFATELFPFLLERYEMTSEQAWKTLKDLRYNGKKKLSLEEKRALELAMVRICEEVGKRVLSEKDEAHE